MKQIPEKQLSGRRRVISSAFAVVALLPLAAARAMGAGVDKAPADPVVHLSRPQASSLTTALDALSAQAHVAFVAEGQPLSPTLTPGQAQALTLAPQGEPLSALVREIADAYDYDAKRTGPVFRLTKRYTDRRDLPDVTLEECALDVEYAESLTDHFSTALGDGGAMVIHIRPNLASLTPAQLQAAGGDGVPVTSLSPDMQEALQQYTLDTTPHFPKTIMQGLVVYIKGIAQDDPRFCRHDLSTIMSGLAGTAGVPVFGFEMPKTTTVVDGKQRPHFTVLSDPSGSGSSVISGGGEAPMINTDGHDHFQHSKNPDMTEPSSPPAPPRPLLGETLAQVVTRLDARTPGGLPLAVEESVAPKRALVLGDQYATPTQVLEALAGVYGLRVRDEDPYGLRAPGQGLARLILSRPRPDPPVDLLGLAQAVRQSLPAPLLRARATRNGGSYGMVAPRDFGLSPKDVNLDLRSAAVRELRAVVEPKLKAAPDGRVALSSLTERERAALAVAISLGAIDGLGASDNVFISRFSELRLKAQSYDKATGKGYGLFLNLTADGGSSSNGPVADLPPPAQ